MRLGGTIMAGTNETTDLDLGYDLTITRRIPRSSASGTWVSGRIHGHRFEALVFPEQAENREWELDDSRISKLWLQRLADRQEVFNWDRGLDVPAADATVQAIMDFLATGLVDYVLGK
jgi:hypothetical protein